MLGENVAVILCFWGGGGFLKSHENPHLSGL